MPRCRSDEHWCAFALSCGEFPSRPTAVRLNVGRLSVVDRLVGSGQFATPWERMQRAKARNSFQSCAIWAWVSLLPPLGIKWRQAVAAESNREGFACLALTT